MSYPDSLEITPLTGPPLSTVRVPGSKSITNRALVLAALGSWSCETRLRGALWSEDPEVMVEGLRALGYRISPDWQADPPVVTVEPPFDETEEVPADLSLW